MAVAVALLALHFFIAQQPVVGNGRPNYQGFTISLRHTTLSKTSLDK